MADGARSEAGRFVGACELTAEVASAICGRVAAGESLMALGRDPAMPHRTTIRRWADRDLDFRARLAAAMREARLARRRRDREAAVRRAAELAARPRAARGGSVSFYSRELGEAICARLANGESLVAIGRDADMPCCGTVYGWLNRHAEFADLYAQARQAQADYYFDEAREVALGSTHATVWSDRLRFDVIRWQTARLTPKKYCERLVVEAEVSARRAQAAQDAGEAKAGSKRLTVKVVDFQRGPNGKVVVAPPRNEAEEVRWVEAYGRPYDGPR
jgi:hypothetical protein